MAYKQIGRWPVLLLIGGRLRAIQIKILRMEQTLVTEKPFANLYLNKAFPSKCWVPSKLLRSGKIIPYSCHNPKIEKYSPYSYLAS